VLDQAYPEIAGTVVGLEGPPLPFCGIKIGVESGEHQLDLGNALAGDFLYLRVSLRLTDPSVQR
jgi:hypothetical protein